MVNARVDGIVVDDQPFQSPSSTPGELAHAQLFPVVCPGDMYSGLPSEYPYLPPLTKDPALTMTPPVSGLFKSVPDEHELAVVLNTNEPSPTELDHYCTLLKHNLAFQF